VIEIAGRSIGQGHPAFIVAELSGNHRQSLKTAIALVHAARRAGADAIKLQTYTADTMTVAVDAPAFRLGQGNTWSGRTLHDLYEEAHTPWAWHAELKKAAEDDGLIWFSTPFDQSSVAFLEGLNAPAYKIASFELVDLPLIETVARTGKPVIVSTGLGTHEEIAEAVAAVRQHGGDLVLLKCTSAYPAEPRDMHLAAIPALRDAFGTEVGLSDHSPGWTVAVAAVALGACIIEKHLTLERAAGGPDAAFSMEPAEFAELVARVRDAEAAIGTDAAAAPAIGEREQPNLVFRRSIFVVEDMAAGETFSERTIRCIRPGLGLKPKFLRDVIGKKAVRAIARGTPLSWDLIEP
jgi:pseudaminic acid synthase